MHDYVINFSSIISNSTSSILATVPSACHDADATMAVGVKPSIEMTKVDSNDPLLEATKRIDISRISLFSCASLSGYCIEQIIKDWYHYKLWLERYEHFVTETFCNRILSYNVIGFNSIHVS